MPSVRTLTASSPPSVLRPKPGNQPPLMVLRPKPSKPSISAWPPRDLSDAGTCRTSRCTLMPSSRSRAPAAWAAYFTRHRPRRLGPRRRILLSRFLLDPCTMWAARDSTRHLRVPRPKSTHVHPQTFHLTFTSRRRPPRRPLHLHFTIKASINTQRLSITHHIGLTTTGTQYPSTNI